MLVIKPQSSRRQGFESNSKSVIWPKLFLIYFILCDVFLWMRSLKK